MKNKIKHFSALSGAVVVASLLVGCQDFDADHSYSDLSQVVFNQEYADNFIKEYGDLSQVKSWDLSSLGDELNYVEGALTRATTDPFSEDPNYEFHPIVGEELGDLSEITIGSQTEANYYNLPVATFDWLTKNMTENVEHTDGKKRNIAGKDHSAVPGAGKNFKMLKPKGDFWLLPIYQGYAESCFDLHLVVNGTDYLVWTKGQGLEVLKKKYQYKGYFYFTNEDGGQETGTKTIISENKEDFTNQIKVGDICIVKYKVLTDDVTPEEEGTYKHSVTFNISGKTAKNEVINTSETSLVGQTVEFSYTYYKVDAPVYKSSDWIDLADKTTDKNFCTLEKSPYNAWEVRCKPIHFDASKFNDDFYFYLEITKSVWRESESSTSKNAAIPGTKQRSDKGMMAAMAAAVQSDIAAVTGSTDYNALLLGCEAANRGSSDYDYNDVVFLMVSNSPQTIIETEERRYLCEDLGSTYDFDFNDIVVDVKQTQLVTTSFTETNPTTHAGAWSRTLSDRTQTVSIARMCGTIPFQVYIGDDEGNMVNPVFCFDQMTPEGIIEGTKRTNGYTPTSPPDDVAKYCKSAKVDEGDNKNIIWWDVTKHNIYINTWPNGTDGQSTGTRVMHTAKFPTYDPGTIGSADYSPQASNNVPQIIAVDPTVKWMDEKVHIPTAWVTKAKTIDITNDTK